MCKYKSGLIWEYDLTDNMRWNPSPIPGFILYVWNYSLLLILKLKGDCAKYISFKPEQEQ